MELKFNPSVGNSLFKAGYALAKDPAAKLVIDSKLMDEESPRDFLLRTEGKSNQIADILSLDKDPRNIGLKFFVKIEMEDCNYEEWRAFLGASPEEVEDMVAKGKLMAKGFSRGMLESADAFVRVAVKGAKAEKAAVKKKAPAKKKAAPKKVLKLDKAELESMKIVDLKKIAKAEGIPSFSKYSKAELIKQLLK